MSKLKKLAGETVLYGLGSIIPRFLNFLLVRLHTDVFAPEEYGIITKLFAYTAVINTIFLFGMETAYFRFSTKPLADEKKTFNLAQTVVIAISLSLSLIMILFSNGIANALDIGGKPQFIYWLAAIMFVDAVVAIPFAQLRLHKKAVKFAVGKLVNILILVGLNIYFLKVAYHPSRGVDFVLLANLIANAFYVLLFFNVLLSWRPIYNKEISPQMIRYGYPILLTGLAGMTNEMFSRIMLEAWLPKNFYPGRSAEYALGIFGACYKFAVLMNLAVQAFRYAAEPFFFSNVSDKNSPILFARINHYFIIVCCLLLFVVMTNIDLLKHFLGSPAYWEGLEIVPILLLGYLFLGVYYNVSVWFKLTDRTYYGTLITVGGAIVTIIANYILIPRYGYLGSSWGTFICYLSMLIACYVIGQKYFPVPYKVAKGFGFIIFTAAAAYLISLIKFENQLLASTFHIVVLIFYLLIVYLLEKKELRQSLQ